MVSITLRTASGGFVSKQSIPQFNPMPEVIKWGDRVFVQPFDFDPMAPVYVEGLCFTVSTSPVC